MKLKEIRERTGLTQAEVARQLGISPPVYNRYETGVREPPYETLCRIADFFNVPIDELLGRSPLQEEAPQIAYPDRDLRFALWGGDADQITPEQLEEVKRFAAFVLERGKK